MDTQKKIDKKRNSALWRYIEATNKVNEAIANFRTDQQGFRKDLAEEILRDIRRQQDVADRLDPPKHP